jgi:hypothetical protein
MTQAILADRPDGQALVVGCVPSLMASNGGWLAEWKYTWLPVPCVPCGASQFQRGPGGVPCGARRLLAVDRGHPDPGAWLTRYWLAGAR